MKNNLFNYATKELSQDAFICWLCSCALSESRNPSLKECAEELIVLFVPELKHVKFAITDVERQVKHVDVLITVETSDTTYKIIVEDKTHTKQHGNQLEDYLVAIKKEYPNYEVRGAYYKTGFQSDMSKVIEAGYSIVKREQMLELMKKHVSKTDNQIFLDYYEYWDDFQKETERYAKLPVSQWNWKQIYGCYDSLKKTADVSLPDLRANYSYVSNKSGGFEAMWFATEKCKFIINGIETEIYLQLETKAGCFSQLRLKINVIDKKANESAIKSIRNSIIFDDDGIYSLVKFNFTKPNKLGLGKYMTLGIYNAPMAEHQDVENAVIKAAADYSRIISRYQPAE